MNQPMLTVPTEGGEMQVFQFDAKRVRIIDRDGEPWWVLADVCDIIGLADRRQVAERVDQDDRYQIPIIDSMGRSQPTWCVNESGLYATILRSDKPDAKRFRHWITSEVLPSIRKTGSYSITVPKTLSEALRLAADLEDKRIALEAKIAKDAPKVELAEAIGKTERAMSITDAAKHFGLHPKLEVFPYLRALRYLTQDDLPTQAAIDQGYLSLKQTKDHAGNTWPQAVVEVWQLENWRSHVVPQIKRWAKSQEIPA